MIKYDKLFNLLKENGYTPKKIKDTNIISQSTIANIKSGKGGLTHDNINKLCYLLHCLPSDLMEFVYDAQEEDDIISGRNIKKRGIHASKNITNS